MKGVGNASSPAAAMQVGILENVFIVEGVIFIFSVSMVLLAKYLHEKLK